MMLSISSETWYHFRVALISQNSIQEVIDKMDAVAVVGDYVRLEKRSGRYVGLCPFHNEKTPSFTVNPDQKLYYCFGCGRGGTVLNFVMEMDKISFPEAVEAMAKRLGVELIYENIGGGKVKDDKQSMISALQELYTRVAGSFHYCLTQTNAGKFALDYVLSRGINAEMIEKFRLGYSPPDRRWLFEFLTKKGYSEEFLLASRLFWAKYPQKSFFGDRLMFPINNQQGKTVAFGGRLLRGDGPKYINSTESPIYKKGQTLFALDLALPEIRKTKQVYMVEGYLDVIALHQVGITNAVAPLGTAFTDEQAQLLRRFAERIDILPDNDSAGRSAVIKEILTCRRNGLTAYIAVSEENGEGKTAQVKDPADILKEFGKESLTNYTKRVIIDFDYLLFRSKSFNNAISEGEKAIAFMFPYLETLDSEIARDAAFGRIADAFHVDRESVRNDFNRKDWVRMQDRVVQPGIVQKSATQNISVRLNDELFLLATIAVNGNYPQFRPWISIKEIEDPAAKDLFIAMEDCFSHDEVGPDNKIKLDALLPRISSENVRKFISERGVSDEFFSNSEKLISDGIKRIKLKRIERRRAKIVIELSIAASEKDASRIEELLLEKEHLDTELQSLKG
ncbi:MAG: DNA primase [Treponema sp.]|jgi:DNA primase|nr:DNA primase [Treponema sp.]